MTTEPHLTGCYLLVVLAEPICEDHKEKIIQRVAKGLLSWNTIQTECDLKEIETAIQNTTKTNRFDSPEILLQDSNEKLAVEVLISPSVSTLRQCMKNMFLSPTAHKHLIHGGYSFTGTGSWMLDDGLFSFDDFFEIIEDNSVHNFLESYSDSMFTLHIHCSAVGQWVTNDFKAQSFSKYIRIELNPMDSPTGVQGAAALLDFLDESLKPTNLDSKMTSTEYIGNIRFNRPTLYIFPSGQGDCSLFGVSGFTMLIDGGCTPVPSFWNFIRHLERLDAIMVTRLSEDNLWGFSSLFKKKILKPIYPQIGYLFCNITEGVADSDKKQSDSNELLVSVIGIGQEFLGNVKQIGLSPLQCLREPLDSIEPMTLYHKVGLGTLQMYILSPPRDNKILKEFLNHWSTGKESFSLVRTGSASHNKSDVAIPLSNLMSICCLLVWKPYNINEEITRILFPGSAPQSRIFEGLNKIEKLDIFSQQKCTQSSIKTSLQTKEVKSSKPNRFRSVSPISRSKPIHTKQHSIELEKNKTIEEDNHYISSSNKQKQIKPIPQKKSEKKEPIKETVKKSAPTTKTEGSTEKRSVSQSPKKVIRNKKPNQTKTQTKTTENKKADKKSEHDNKISLTLNGNENQSQDIIQAVNEKRDSLERENIEFQNKLLHSEYLKDDMEPDSLESLITDGKISKDSLEVSEDETTNDKLNLKTDIKELEATLEEQIKGNEEESQFIAGEDKQTIVSSTLDDKQDLKSRIIEENTLVTDSQTKDISVPQTDQKQVESIQIEDHFSDEQPISLFDTNEDLEETSISQRKYSKHEDLAELSLTQETSAMQDKRNSIIENVGITSSQVSEQKRDSVSEEKDSKIETLTEEPKFESQKGTTVESHTKEDNERKQSIDKTIDSLGKKYSITESVGITSLEDSKETTDSVFEEESKNENLTHDSKQTKSEVSVKSTLDDKQFTESDINIDISKIDSNKKTEELIESLDESNIESTPEESEKSETEMSGRRESVKEVVVSNQIEDKLQTNESKNTKVSESSNNNYKNDELSSKTANKTSEKDESIKQSSSYLADTSVDSNLESSDKFDEMIDPSVLCKDFDNKINFNENNIKESQKVSEQRKSSTSGVDESSETNVFTDLTKNTNKRSSVSDVDKSIDEKIFSDLTESTDNLETISLKSHEEKRSSISGTDQSNAHKYVIIEERKNISETIDNLDNNSANISGTTSAQQIDDNKTHSDTNEDSTQNSRKISLSNDPKNINEEIKEKEKLEENRSKSDLKDKTDIIIVSKSDSNDNQNKNKSLETDITLSDDSKQTTIELIDEKDSKIKVVTKDSNEPNITDIQLTGKTETSEDSNKTITSLESSKVESISKESKDLSPNVLSKDTNSELNRFEESETKSLPSNQLQPSIEDKSKSKQNESEPSKPDDINKLSRSSELEESSKSGGHQIIPQKPMFFENKKSISDISDDFDEISPNSSDMNRSDLFKESDELVVKIGDQKPEVIDKSKEKIEVNMDLKSEIELVEKMNVSSDESDRKNSFVPQIVSQTQSFAKDLKKDSFGTESQNISQTNVAINKLNTDLDQNFKQIESDISSKEIKESIDNSKICEHKENQKPDLKHIETEMCQDPNNKEIKTSERDHTIGSLSSISSKTNHEIEDSNQSNVIDSTNLKTDVFPVDDKSESQTHRKSVDITKTDDKNLEEIRNKEKNVEEININLNSKPKTESSSKPMVDSTNSGQTVEIEFFKTDDSKNISKEKTNEKSIEINLSADHSKQSEIGKQSEESVKPIQSIDKQKVENKLTKESNLKDSNIEELTEKELTRSILMNINEEDEFKTKPLTDISKNNSSVVTIGTDLKTELKNSEKELKSETLDKDSTKLSELKTTNKSLKEIDIESMSDDYHLKTDFEKLPEFSQIKSLETEELKANESSKDSSKIDLKESINEQNIDIISEKSSIHFENKGPKMEFSKQEIGEQVLENKQNISEFDIKYERKESIDKSIDILGKKFSISENVGITSLEISEQKTDSVFEGKDSKIETLIKETKFEAQKGTNVEIDTKEDNQRKKSIDSLGKKNSITESVGITSLEDSKQTKSEILVDSTVEAPKTDKNQQNITRIDIDLNESTKTYSESIEEKIISVSDKSKFEAIPNESVKTEETGIKRGSVSQDIVPNQSILDSENKVKISDNKKDTAHSSNNNNNNNLEKDLSPSTNIIKTNEVSDKKEDLTKDSKSYSSECTTTTKSESEVSEQKKSCESETNDEKIIQTKSSDNFETISKTHEEKRPSLSSSDQFIIVEETKCISQNINESIKGSEERKASICGAEESTEKNIFTDLTKSSDNSEIISSKSNEEKRSSISGTDQSISDKYVIIEERKSISENIDILDNISSNISGTTSAHGIDDNNMSVISKDSISSKQSKDNSDLFPKNNNNSTENMNKSLIESKNKSESIEEVLSITNRSQTESVKPNTRESIEMTSLSQLSSDERYENELNIDKSRDKTIKGMTSGTESKVNVHNMPSTHIRRTSQVVEQPLYEESDEEENRSTQITEQMIVSTTLSVDFPELISLSGGTTPSQSAPQSPHDSKSLSRSESIRSREKITIIDTIPEDKDSEKLTTDQKISSTSPILPKSPSDIQSSQMPKTSDGKGIKVSNISEGEVKGSAFDSSSLEKEIKDKDNQKSEITVIEVKDNKQLEATTDSKGKKTSSEVVIIESTSSEDRKFSCDQWGKPLSLPTPPDPSEKVLNKANTMKTNATKTSKPNVKKSNGIEGSGNAVYVELAYVPHHGDQHYCNADYFKRVRAKYYVFSGINPHREVFEALIEGKKVWDKQFTTTVIPTHESESLGFWINNNRNLLDEYMICVAPAADRCTVNLQDHETKCSAYRVEF